jgi:hypothetical protein
MSNICFLSTGNVGENLIWVSLFSRHLSKKGNNIFIVSRVKPEIYFKQPWKRYFINFKGCKFFELYCDRINLLYKYAKLEHIYESEEFQEHIDFSEVMKLEKWLGVSLNYVLSLDRRFYNREKLQDSRDKEVLIYVGKLVKFFKEFFFNNKIDCIVLNLEDQTFQNIAYFVAKRIGIKVIGIGWSRFPKNGIMFLEDFREVLEWNYNQDISFEDIKKMYDDTTIVGKDMIKITHKSARLTYPIQKTKTGLGYFQIYFNTIKNNSYERYILNPPLPEIMNVIEKPVKYNIVKMLSKSIYSNPNPKEKYFFFPLHYTQDAQMTFREPFTNQYEVIKHCARSLPIGCLLYVKPHPHHLGSDIKLKYIQELSKLKNVKIINPAYSPINLIQNSMGVITINSTAGFEALIFGKPVISFGHDFYCGDDIVYLIKDIGDLPKYLVESIIKGQKDQNKAIDFIKKVYVNTVWTQGGRLSLLTNEDAKKISYLINKILNEI